MEYKLLKSEKGKSFLLKDFTKDFSTHLGMIRKEDLLKAKSGDIIKTNKGEKFLVETPNFYDLFKKIKRKAQIITLKDIGAIIANTLVGPQSFCVDAGSGTGALCCILSRYVKKVVSFDIRKDHQDIAIANANYLGIENIQFRLGNIFEHENINEKDVDLLTLDVTTPWEAIKTADKILKVGGFVASYSPSITQNERFVDQINQSKTIEYQKTIEIIEREWEVEGQRVLRPVMRGILHTGFISFAKKIR
ncbi:MAG TPA: methyltransferase domain-containing protein [Candidatus Woesearchaeota archaeon]|nr:methyltransferase domain-containing protein [Candidatus Woesearchaeota archaeon]